MDIITKEIRGNIKIRKIFGIPFLTKHTKILAIGERYKYRLFGIPIYQKLSYHTQVPATPQESLPQDMSSIHKKLDRMGY